MKQKNTWLCTLLLLMAVTSAKLTIGQSACTTAVILNPQQVSAVRNSSITIKWYEFTATEDTIDIELSSISGLINKIELYRGPCDSLVKIEQDTISNATDSLLQIHMNNLVLGKPYKVKVITSTTPVSYDLLLITVRGPFLIAYDANQIPYSYCVNQNGAGNLSTICGVAGNCNLVACPTQTIYFRLYLKLNCCSSGNTNWRFSGLVPDILSTPYNMTTMNDCSGSNQYIPLVIPSGASGNYLIKAEILYPCGTCLPSGMISTTPFGLDVVPSVTTPPILPVSPVCTNIAAQLDNSVGLSGTPDIVYNYGDLTSGISPSHIYTNAGSYTLTKTKTSGFCTGVPETTIIQVNDFSINLSLLYKCGLNVDITKNFSCNLSSMYGTYMHTWGIIDSNGNTLYSTNSGNNPTINFTFPNNGTYTIFLQTVVQNGPGFGTYTETQTIVINAPPIVGVYCCQTAAFSLGTSPTSNVNYSTNSNGAGAIVDMQGIVTFNANSTMSNYVLRMAPSTTIIIAPNVTVNFNNCTFFSCTDLWGGIIIDNGSNNPGNLNVINCSMEDMYFGIMHRGPKSGNTPGVNGNIAISGSKFNKNYVSVQLRNFPNYNNGAPRYGLTITTSTFSSIYSATSPQTGLKSSSIYTYAYNKITSPATPYTNFPRSLAGIYLYNLEEKPVIIGDSTGVSGVPNRFENLDFGILAENASIYAFNNHFINITGSTKQYTSLGFPPSPPPAGPEEIGIGISSVSNLLYNYYFRIGTIGASTPTTGDPFPGGNKFEDCGKGIGLTNYNDPYIRGNSFRTTSTSIPPLVMPSLLYSYHQAQCGIWLKDIAIGAQILNNYVVNQSTGIYTSHNIDLSIGTPSEIRIEGNAIIAPGATGYCKQAIYVDQPLSTVNMPAGGLIIKNNTISNVYNGIRANNIKGGLQINSNPIIKIDVAKLYGITGINAGQINTYARTGILAAGCVDAVIANNPNIIGNGTINPASTYYTAVKGIWMNGSGGTNGQVNCNTISNMGRCMQFSNTSLNKVVKNVMNGTYQGFVLSTSGQIGDQGHNTTTTHDNEWIGFTGGAAQYAETYSESSSTNANVNSRFYVKSGSPYQPTQNYSAIAGNQYQTGFNLGVEVKTGLSGESCLLLRMMGEDNGVGMAMRTASGEDTSVTKIYEALASDTVFYDVYANETQYRNQQLVYDLLSSHSIEATQALEDFYTTNQNSNYQALMDINDAMGSHNYQTAQSINSRLTANNTIEEYQKRVNELLLTYLNYKPQYDTINDLIRIAKNSVFDGIELADLMTIANSCLDKYGNVIAQARVLVNNVSNKVVEFEENCNPEYNSRKTTTVKADNSSNISVRLYPNPNKGIMTLEYDLVNDKEATMNLYDIAGKLITTYKLQSTKGTLQMNEQTLQNGIYFYHILVEGKTVKTEKIVIIK